MRFYDGEFTFANDGTGQRRTFRLQTMPADAEFAPGARVVSVLTGPDNERDYRGFAFVVEGDVGLALWRRFKDDPEFLAYVAMMEAYFLKACRRGFKRSDNSEGLDHVPSGNRYSVSESRRCVRCGRLLTTPESIAAGIGPVCAEKDAVDRAEPPVDAPGHHAATPF